MGSFGSMAVYRKCLEWDEREARLQESRRAGTKSRFSFVVL